MTNYPRDEATAAWHDSPQTTRRDRALMNGFDPHPDDDKPSAQWVQDQLGGELLDALAASIEQARQLKGEQSVSIDLTPGSPEWCRRVSPSKVAAILGISPWDSQRSMWHKMRGEAPWDEESPAMERGTLCEPAVLAWWRKHHDHEGWEDQPSFVLGDWCAATPDAITREGGDEVLIEAKTAANMDDYGDPGTDAIPAYYLTQVYFAMEVARRAGRPVARAHVPVLGGYRLLFSNYVVEYDAKIGGELMARMEAWGASLDADEPPPLDDSVATFDTMRQLHAEIDRGESVEVAESDAHDLIHCHAALDTAKAASRMTKSAVLDVMGRAQYATYNGVRIARRQPRGEAVTFVVVGKPSDLTEVENVA